MLFFCCDSKQIQFAVNILYLGEPHQDPDHQDYVPSVMPSCYRREQTQKAQEQASSRHQRLLERKEAEKQRVLIAEAAQKEAERKQKCAEKERLEAATTLVEFSQQVFIKEQSTQTETASPSKTVANCSTQTDGDVTTVVKESEQLKRKLQSSIFRATIIRGNDSLTQLYTVVFLHIVMFLTPFATTPQSTALTIEDEIFLTLVRPTRPLP